MLYSDYAIYPIQASKPAPVQPGAEDLPLDTAPIPFPFNWKLTFFLLFPSLSLGGC